MEKLRLNDGTEFTLTYDKSRENEKLRIFKFTSEQGINTILDIVSDSDNFALVQVNNTEGELLRIYQDIASFIGLSIDKDVQIDDTVADIYTVKYSTDVITKSVTDVKTKLEELDKQINPTIDLDSCTLDELKVYKISKSKENLEVYLKNNPIESLCHNGTEKQYSITKEKQTFLTQIIFTAQAAQLNNIEYQPSWNAVGEPCSYDWTIQELQQLAFEIEAIVRPLISKQQTIEAQINATETKEDVMAISIEFKEESL